jgi:hypothetical protein
MRNRGWRIRNREIRNKKSESSSLRVEVVSKDEIKVTAIRLPLSDFLFLISLFFIFSD